MKYVLTATVNHRDSVGELPASMPLDLNGCFDAAHRILRQYPQAMSFTFIVVPVGIETGANKGGET